MEKTSNVGAIKRYFEEKGGRKITMQEMRELSQTDREEMGAMAAKALGLEIENPK